MKYVGNPNVDSDIDTNRSRQIVAMQILQTYKASHLNNVKCPQCVWITTRFYNVTTLLPPVCVTLNWSLPWSCGWDQWHSFRRVVATNWRGS